jgi:hypothetical protein
VCGPGFAVISWLASILGTSAVKSRKSARRARKWPTAEICNLFRENNLTSVCGSVSIATFASGSDNRVFADEEKRGLQGAEQPRAAKMHEAMHLGAPPLSGLTAAQAVKGLSCFCKIAAADAPPGPEREYTEEAA